MNADYSAKFLFLRKWNADDQICVQIISWFLSYNLVDKVVLLSVLALEPHGMINPELRRTSS